jgi:hypothetical protein
MGRHARYRISDVIDWETARVDDRRETAKPTSQTRQALEQVAHAPSHDGATARNVASV